MRVYRNDLPALTPPPPRLKFNQLEQSVFWCTGVANKERLSDVDVIFPRFPTVTHFSRVCQ